MHRFKLHLNIVSMSILLQNFLKDENCILVGILQQAVVIPHVSHNYCLHNDPEECSFHLLRGRSLKSRILERLQQNLVLGIYFGHSYRNLILATTGPKQPLFNVKLTMSQSPKKWTIQKSSVKHKMHNSFRKLLSETFFSVVLT